MESPEHTPLPDNTPNPAAAGELSLSALNQAYRTLRVQFLAVLLTLVILCGSLNIYLLRQVSLVRRDLEANRPVVEKIVAEYVRSGEPTIKDFLNKLEVFSKTHPDFRPILAKYVNSSDTATVPVQPKSQPVK
ncbi:MAG: hypothetical protein ACYDH9_12205 [Limisphaerales bacterium]